MPDIAQILRHNLVGKMFNHGCVFLINVLIVRLLGSSLSGTFFNELYLLNFLAFIASMGLDYAAIHYYGKDPRLLYAINRKLLRISLAGAVSLIILLWLFSYVTEWGTRTSPVAALMFTLGNLLLILYQGVLSARKLFNLQNIILAVTNLIYLIILFWFHQSKKDISFEWIAGGYAILFLAQGIIITAVCFGGENLKGPEITVQQLVRHGVPIMISSLVYFAFLRVDNFFVERFAAAEDLGAYVQCGKMGQYFLYFSSIISSTILPFVRSEHLAGTLNEWRKLMRPYIAMILFAALIIGVSGYWVFPFVFGEGFENMYLLMLIFLPGFICLGILTLMNAVYIGNNKIGRIFRGDLLGLSLVLVLDFMLVPRFGSMAAAMISSSSYIVVFLYLFAGFKSNFSS
jgi:O-antigen/teichoic acid export membrane protein